jgi:cytochrome P450
MSLAGPTLPQLARITPSPGQLGPVRLFTTVVRNPIEAWPEAVYREPVARSSFLGRPTVFVCAPELIRQVLVDQADVFEKDESLRRALRPALGDGILTADHANWRWQRRAAAPIFRHDRILGFLPAMIAAAERTRERWLAGAGKEINVAHEMMRTTFDIIVETMMSGPGRIDVARVEQGITDYLKPTGWVFALSILDAPDWLPYPGRRKAMAAATYLRSAIIHMIAERRRSREAREDLVALLLAAADPESGRTMSDEEIADNLLTFVTAGHETTALGLAWTFLLLARHPEHEARVIAEIDRVTGGAAVQPEHVAGLAYTRQVFSEAMRLYPPAPIITRTATQAFSFGGFTVAEGTVIIVPIHAVHHHASIWENPERFDPERFAPEQAKGRHRYAYMPFGAGPRICIGSAFATMEAVAILAVLLQAVRLRSRSGEMPKPRMKVTLRPRQEPRMQVERRS